MWIGIKGETPDLLVGDCAWDTDTAGFPEPHDSVWPGSPWWIAVSSGSEQQRALYDSDDERVAVVDQLIR